MVAEQLDPLSRLSKYFSPPLPERELHLIVELGDSVWAAPRSIAVPTRAITDEDRRKHKRLRPSLPTLIQLEDGYLNEPLPEDRKVPIRPDILQTLVTPECDKTTLLKLFHPTQAVAPMDRYLMALWSAIALDPPSSQGGEGAMITFWDRHVRNIAEYLVKDCEVIRGDNRLTETGLRRPDFGLCLRGFCLLRGEEAGPNTDGDPEQELGSGLVWSFDLDYVFGG
jgi:hypothetical protein